MLGLVDLIDDQVSSLYRGSARYVALARRLIVYSHELCTGGLCA